MGKQMPGWNGLNSLSKFKQEQLLHFAAGRPEAQVVPFPLGWTSDPMGVGCTISLLQDNTAWGNKSCKTLSLLFPTVKGSNRPPKTVWPPFHDANYTSCLSLWGEQLAFLGNVSGCRGSQSFESSSPSALLMTQMDVWWYCGEPLLGILPADWSGTCTLVQLAVRFTLAFLPRLNPSTNQT